MRAGCFRRAAAVLLTVAAGSGLLLGTGRASAATGYRLAGLATQAPAGVSRAYQFLNQMMDMQATGTVPRLVRSYTGGVLGTENYTASSIYDDALIIDDSPQAEDVNSWSYLALRSPAYAASVGWDVRNLASAAGRLRGISICPGDRTGVWFEGTAHLADALETRDQPGDSAQAAAYLADIAYAQAHGPNENGLGIMAASKDGLTDCEGDSVYASLHTGTTAWYILAARGINPLAATTPISAQ
jgi:hypothetical protein